ncbi:MAG: D-alanyl-D-alanine carboxypeptidase [Sediminibacterium sp.]|nr:D-alanyl-D-alanine carboxypeptidase [Sediminibacterium sp.]
MKIWLYALTILYCTSCISVKKTNSKNPQQFFLDTLTKSFYNNRAFDKSFLGIAIADIPSEKNLIQYHSQKYFIPASTAKLFTTYLSLAFNQDSLDGFLYYENQDTLFLFPCGDPTFLNSDFNTNLMEQKLSQFSKQIVFMYPNQPLPILGYGWSWEDYDQEYMVETNSFPVYKNLVHFTGTANNIQTKPMFFSNSNYFKNDNLNNNMFSVTRLLRSNVFYTIPSKQKFDSIDIPFITGDSFVIQQQILTQQFPGLKSTAMPISRYSYQTSLQPFATNPLLPILKQMLLVSDNYIAEQLIINKSLIFNQQTPNSAKVRDSALNLLFPNNPNRPKWVDGSGLSRYNLFSPQQFISLILKLNKDFGSAKISRIMSKGNEGTLKNLFTKYPERIRAKTGTLSNNIALCGFIETLSNKTLAFSIMINNHQEKNKNLRQLIETYLNLIIEKY